MGKILASISFIAFMISSLWMLVSQERISLKKVTEGEAIWASVSEIRVQTWEKDRVTATMMATSAKYIAPDKMHFFGGVTIVRAEETGTRSLKSDEAVAEIPASKFSELMTSAKIEKIRFTGNVETTDSKYTLRTQSAVYNLADKSFTSTVPSHVTGGQLEMLSDSGFRYDTVAGDLFISGALKGVVQPAPRTGEMR